LKTDGINSQKILFAILSGLLLTGSFPRISFDPLAWFALVPLLFAMTDLSPNQSFRMGLLTGLVHYLTLLFWLVPTMKTYGHLPLYLCVPVLILFSFYLALYIGIFGAVLTQFCSKPASCIFMVPTLWVSIEYTRSFLFSGFPWGFLGYSQFNNLHLIQISDLTGPYGVSFLIAFANAVFFLTCLYLGKKKWRARAVTGRHPLVSIFALALVFTIIWTYGEWRMKSVDKLVSTSPSAKVTIVQGNISQAEKWDPAFQETTTKKYIDLSLSAKTDQADIVIWPETATPFYFLYNTDMSALLKKGIRNTGTHFLIGSPSFVRGKNNIEYYNSAYMINPDGEVADKYDKVHLVPFGEYVPFKKWLPFLGKIVEQVGDFRPGKKGKTIEWKEHKIGVQICYEIIFPNLSRALAKNNAALLANITNDAWFGKTGAPYQHFSMAVFRAVENRRTLARSANTGISGFIDPVGRIIASTPLFQESTLTRTIPLIQTKTFYTRFGDLFAGVCMAATLLIAILKKRLIF
jgi:apolipoprotein N-acyltransferase